MNSLDDVEVTAAGDYPITQGALAVEPQREMASDASAERPEPSEERKALVEKLLKRIDEAKGTHREAFKAMKSDLAFARAGCDTLAWGTDKYVANLAARHVRQKTAQLYAKNPRVRARRAERIWYQIWDGNPESAMAATQLTAAAVATEVDPTFAPPPEMMQQVMQAQALIADIQQGMEKQRVLDRVGKTMEILFHHFIGKSNPPFKTHAKQLVRRAIGTGIGYIKLGFQRQTGRDPTIVNQLNDTYRKLEKLATLLKDVEGEEYEEKKAEQEELTLMAQEMEASPDIVLREGLVFDFPQSWSIIPLGTCRHIKGFVGCTAVAEEMMFTPAQVKEKFGLDLKKGKYKVYSESGVESEGGDGNHCCFYELYDSQTGLMYSLIEGFDDFVEEPREPTVKIPQFFPYFVLSWNDLEDDKKVFPLSDIALLRHQQMEHNRQREALRQHRIANTPKYLASSGAMDVKAKGNIMSAVPHEIIEINALAPGQKSTDVIAPLTQIPIDPQMYNTQEVYTDYLLTTGNQQADLGPTSKSTATEVSIAAQSRAAGSNADVDELDDVLSDLANAAGTVMLRELSPQTVKEIAGEFAAWPQWTAKEAAELLYLEIEAGSSGKRRMATELNNWQQLVPIALQIPGISPAWLAKETVKRMDDRVDLAEAIVEGAPAIMMMNRQQQVLGQQQAKGPPEAQGSKGGANAPKPKASGPPAPSGDMPAPGERVPGPTGMLQ